MSGDNAELFAYWFNSQKWKNKIDSLVGLVGIVAKCFEVTNGLVKDFLIFDGGENRLIVAHTTTRERSESGEYGDMLADQLNCISGFDNC